MKNPTVLGRCDTNEGCDIEVIKHLSKKTAHGRSETEEKGGFY